MALNKYTSEATQEIRRAIQSGDLRHAIQLRRVIFPPIPKTQQSGFSVGIRDVDECDLHECLHSPVQIFSFCSDKELEELRLRMATAVCLGIRAENAFIPDTDFPWPYPMTPRAVAQNFFKSIAVHWNVSAWLKGGRVSTVKILNSADDPCRVCKAAAHEYSIRQLPQLPLHNCENINTVGCRCSLQATNITGLSKTW